jgi:hypothetical protein
MTITGVLDATLPPPYIFLLYPPPSWRVTEKEKEGYLA